MQAELIHESGVMLFTPKIFRDHRGSFVEEFRLSEIRPYLKGEGISNNPAFVQSNISASLPFVMRGMHYQLRRNKNDPGQGKLIRCVAGKIVQVSVDVRKGSKTYGKWVNAFLDDVNFQAVWVPPGFANGFYAFDRGAVVHYEMTAYHEDDLAWELSWSDGNVGIKWPVQNGGQTLLSAKDRKAPFLADITPWE